MKLCGLITIAFSIGFYGFLGTSRLISSQKQLEKIICLLKFIRRSISYNQLNIRDIMEKANQNPDYSFLLGQVDFSKSDTPLHYKRLCLENSSLFIPAEDKNNLYSFFCSLGKTDVKTQLEYCDMYIATVEKSLCDLKECNSKKIKLYPSISVLGGMLVILIFI